MKYKYSVNIKYKTGDLLFPYLDTYNRNFNDYREAINYAEYVRAWLNVNDKNSSKLLVCIIEIIKKKEHIKSVFGYTGELK